VSANLCRPISVSLSPVLHPNLVVQRMKSQVLLLLSQVRELFPSARGLEMTWHSIVKIQQSLYREVRGGRSACLVPAAGDRRDCMGAADLWSRVPPGFNTAGQQLWMCGVIPPTPDACSIAGPRAGCVPAGPKDAGAQFARFQVDSFHLYPPLFSLQAPGLDPFRPDQSTPVPNFFLAGSYTKQDYIDSMEGATLSGRQCAGAVLEAAPQLAVTTRCRMPRCQVGAPVRGGQFWKPRRSWPPPAAGATGCRHVAPLRVRSAVGSRCQRRAAARQQS
jgi:Flavin containing amine oxidoreductase